MEDFVEEADFISTNLCYVYLQIRTPYLCVRVSVCMYVCMFMSLALFLLVFASLFMYVCMYICICINAFIYLIIYGNVAHDNMDRQPGSARALSKKGHSIISPRRSRGCIVMPYLPLPSLSLTHTRFLSLSPWLSFFFISFFLSLTLTYTHALSFSLLLFYQITLHSRDLHACCRMLQKVGGMKTLLWQ